MRKMWRRSGDEFSERTKEGGSQFFKESYYEATKLILLMKVI